MTTQRLKLRVKLLVLALLMSAAGALVYTAAHAQTLAAPTRISPYDWACLDANGAVLSNHQRFDTAFVACYNNPAGAEIVGGRYRLARATQPPPVPPVPPPVLSQPTLSAVRTDSATAGRHTITLSWTVSENATTYSVERCTVALPAAAPCSNFAGLLGAGALTTLSFANTNLPAGFSYSYRLRGREGLRDLSSPYSNVVTIVIPAEPAAGTAMISWTPPTQHTDGTPITNLAGYRLEYDDVPAEEAGPTFDKPAIVINNPGVSSYAVTNLAPGAWHFRVKAFNSVGVDSQPSNIAIKTIQ